MAQWGIYLAEQTYTGYEKTEQYARARLGDHAVDTTKLFIGTLISPSYGQQPQQQPKTDKKTEAETIEITCLDSPVVKEVAQAVSKAVEPIIGPSTSIAEKSLVVAKCLGNVVKESYVQTKKLEEITKPYKIAPIDSVVHAAVVTTGTCANAAKAIEKTYQNPAPLSLATRAIRGAITAKAPVVEKVFQGIDFVSEAAIEFQKKQMEDFGLDPAYVLQVTGKATMVAAQVGLGIAQPVVNGVQNGLEWVNGQIEVYKENHLQNPEFGKVLDAAEGKIESAKATVAVVQDGIGAVKEIIDETTSTDPLPNVKPDNMKEKLAKAISRLLAKILELLLPKTFVSRFFSENVTDFISKAAVRFKEKRDARKV